MAMPQPAPDRAPLQARPGRPVLVAGDLADLRGPVTGTVELPLWLFWSPDRTFDLDDPATLRWMYQTVLREAARPEDLADYLDGDTLAAVWPDLFLPRGVRQAWEDRFPVLRAAAAPAAPAPLPPRPLPRRCPRAAAPAAAPLPRGRCPRRRRGRCPAAAAAAAPAAAAV